MTITVTETIPEIVAMTEVTHPNVPPLDISFMGVAWNEEERAPALLQMAQQWFSDVVVGVQKSTDGTLDIARQYANTVVEHPHFGFAEPSFQDLMQRCRHRWVFCVSFDEMPDTELLESLSSAVAYAEMHSRDGVLIPFASAIDGVEYSEQHEHLRLFRRHLRWPATMHSEPEARKRLHWPFGHIRHDRSLDEMMVDYLRYYRLGRGDAGWEKHNRMMLHDACEAVAAVKGVGYVQSFDWWPEVRKIAFSEE